jgi:alpha-1,3-rhamnosyltransferase
MKAHTNTLLITVIIPCYNHERYIQKCIQSIIKQDHHNIELIIIDDGSEDGSVAKIQEMVPVCQERFIRFEFRSRPNKGVSTTLNEAIDWAVGDYISFIASDDLLHNKKIALLMNKFEQLDDTYAAIFGDASFIDSDGQAVYLNKYTGMVEINNENSTNSFLEYFTQKRNVQYKKPHIFGHYPSLLEGNYLPAMGAIIKTKYIRSPNNFTSGVTIEDWDMWLKLSQNFLFYFEPRIVAFYRLHERNTFVTSNKKLLLDSLTLLKREESYALGNGFSAQFYSRKATSILGLIKLNPLYFMKYCKEFLDYKFILATIKVIKRKIMDY